MPEEPQLTKEQLYDYILHRLWQEHYIRQLYGCHKELTEPQKIVYALNQEGKNQKEISKLTNRSQSTICVMLGCIESKGFPIKRFSNLVNGER